MSIDARPIDMFAAELKSLLTPVDESRVPREIHDRSIIAEAPRQPYLECCFFLGAFIAALLGSASAARFLWATALLEIAFAVELDLTAALFGISFALGLVPIAALLGVASARRTIPIAEL